MLMDELAVDLQVVLIGGPISKRKMVRCTTADLVSGRLEASSWLMASIGSRDLQLIHELTSCLPR